MAVTPVVCPETLAAVPLPAGNVETVTVPAPAKLNLFYMSPAGALTAITCLNPFSAL